MGLFGGGGTSSSQTLSNTISYNPIINIGDDNESSLDTAQRTDATSTATTKDEFGLSASAGFALAPGSSASGGVASLQRAGDNQPMPTNKTEPMLGAAADNNMLLYIGIGGAALAGAYYLAKKSK